MDIAYFEVQPPFVRSVKCVGEASRLRDAAHVSSGYTGSFKFNVAIIQ